ncbi:MAG: hypothetical protein ACRDQ0_00980 [Pseudonocardia sp.]
MTVAASIAQFTDLAATAQARAGLPEYVTAAGPLLAIANHLTTAADTLLDDIPVIFDGVIVTNVYPIDVMFAVEDAETLAEEHPTGFDPGFARQALAVLADRRTSPLGNEDRVIGADHSNCYLPHLDIDGYVDCDGKPL